MVRSHKGTKSCVYILRADQGFPGGKHIGVRGSLSQSPLKPLNFMVGYK